jgi:hypothetical protein
MVRFDSRQQAKRAPTDDGGRRRVLAGALTLAVAIAAIGAAPAFASIREPAGGPAPINSSSDRNAVSVSFASVAGAPHVAWAEDTTQPGQGNSSAIRVARLTADGTTWAGVADGTPITRRPTASSFAPSLTDVDGSPWVAWSENFDSSKEIRVARLSPAGDAWTRVVDSDHPINRDPNGTADDPVIAAGAGGRPYVAFWELDPGSGSLFFPGHEPGKIWVVRLSADGNAWEVVGGGPANADQDFDSAFPWITIVDGRPWVSYFQVANGSGGPSLQARVARLADDGASWTQVDDPVTEGGFGTFERPMLANVNGTPNVMVAGLFGEPRTRVHVFRPNSDGSGWDRVGSGPATPADTDAHTASIAAVGATPWVSFTAQQSGGGPGGPQVRLARLDGDTWRQAGDGYAAEGGGGLGDRTSLASVNGFPWVAFTQDDGTNPGGPGTPGCCTQARVARLEPEFSGLQAFPSADTATLLAETETFGLPYPLGFDYGQDGGAGTSTTARLVSGQPTFALGEAKGLTPGTLHWFQPFATAGTPLPLVHGPRGLFATPPRSPATGTSGTTGAPQSTPASPKAKLIVAILRAPTRVRRGTRVRLKVLATEAGTLQLRVRRGRRVVRRITRTVPAGVSTVSWSTGRAALRRHRLTVLLRSADGRFDSDSVLVRVLRARRPPLVTRPGL